MIAVAHGVYGATRAKCGPCRREPALRADWGCDERAKTPLARVTCATCMGSGCSACDQGGEVYLYRCPNSYASREILTAFDLLGWAESGVLPADGGMLNQTASFMAFVRLARSERSKIEEAEDRSRKVGNG